LKNSEKKLRAVLDSTPFPVALVDMEDDKINFWSKSAQTLFGHTAPTAAEWYKMAYPDEEYRKEVVERWKPALENVKKIGIPANTGEYNITCKNGSIRICELYATFLTENLIVTFNDITERKKAEEELNDTMTKLFLSNKELEQFAYVASHDLQEPLRMVSSYTQLLAKRYKDKLDTDAHEFIEFAVEGANRMQKLINDLLDFSRLNTRKKMMMITDCNSLLGKVRINLSVMIAEENAVLTNDDLPKVIADETQLMQLFQNLISNGIKYHGDNSSHVHVSAKEEKSEWIFSIKDNGIGIENEFHERIFGIFQRLHSKEEYSGTGIGLAICKRIIDRHGGRIWLESEKDKGTIFYFTIPK
jgi:PAS domain S-box-containing protein